jgi:hypothetical protein
MNNNDYQKITVDKLNIFAILMIIIIRITNNNRDE